MIHKFKIGDKITKRLNEKITDSNKRKWLGEVVDISDPEFCGRCKVKVFGMWDSLTNEQLPWCFPFGNNKVFSSDSGGCGNFSCPKIGSIVEIEFIDDVYHPFYKNIFQFSDSLKNEIAADYENCQVLVVDSVQDLKIYSLVNAGVLIWLKGSCFKINVDGSIEILHKNGSSYIKVLEDNINSNCSNEHNLVSPKVNLGDAPNFSATRAENLFKLLKQLATAIDAKMPSSPGASVGLVNSFEQQVKSPEVFIS